MKRPNKWSLSRPDIFLCFFMLVLALSLASCKAKVEGCMDVTASNWDASADKACDDCCNFPSLLLSISHMYGDTTLFYDSLYVNDIGEMFFITGIRYYVSDVNLYDGSTEVSTMDSIEVEIRTVNGNEEEWIDDNFALLSRTKTSSTIGTFENTDISVDSVFFSVGLNGNASQVDPTSVSSPHPLAIDSDSMFIDTSQQYIFAKISMVHDTMTMDTIVYNITGNINLREIRLPWERDLERGVNISIPLVVNYATWFTGINFADNDEATIKLEMVNNLTNSFSLQQ